VCGLWLRDFKSQGSDSGGGGDGELLVSGGGEGWRGRGIAGDIETGESGGGNYSASKTPN
jgi:hypothetical protein